MGSKPKPSLSALMAAAPARRTKRAKKSTPAVPAPIGTEKRPAELVRALMVRRFVSAFLRDFNAAAALRAVKPTVSVAASRAVAHDLFECQDVQHELRRQLRGIEIHASIDEEWIYRFWMAMANASLLDYIDFEPDTGKVLRWKLDPANLTREQQLMIRELKFDPKSGTVTHIKLVDLEGTVANIAKAKKMFSLLEDETLKHVVQDITARMQQAARTVRTFDHDTGDEIE